MPEERNQQVIGGQQSKSIGEEVSRTEGLKEKMRATGYPSSGDAGVKRFSSAL